MPFSKALTPRAAAAGLAVVLAYGALLITYTGERGLERCPFQEATTVTAKPTLVPPGTTCVIQDATGVREERIGPSVLVAGLVFALALASGWAAGAMLTRRADELRSTAKPR